MDHETKVRWRKCLYKIYDIWGMDTDDIKRFGDPWETALAENLLANNALSGRWSGGGCNGSTFDITIKAESSSGNGQYLIAYKIGEDGNVIDTGHSCGFYLYENVIARRPGPCKHLIAARLFIEREHQESGIKVIYTDDSEPFWVTKKYSGKIMEVFNKIAENRKEYEMMGSPIPFQNLRKRSLFYGYLFTLDEMERL